MSLLGKTVVVTRAQHQAAELVELLKAEGAVPVELPVIDIVDPDDGGDALQLAFANIASYDWLIVTSVNTVHRLPASFPLDGPRVAAIGSGTAERLEQSGYPVSLLPPSFVAESLLEVFPEGTGKVLLPRAAVARDVLPEGLRAKGWAVDVVDAYKTVDLQPSPDVVDAALKADIVTFTAPSTVRAFMKASGGQAPKGRVACIGPVTEKAAVEAGLRVDVSAEEHTLEGLVHALLRLSD